MKLVTLALAALLPTVVLAQEPTFYSGTHVTREPELEKRVISGTVKVDGLRCRSCPRTSCPAVGQYPIGTHISIVCYTRDNTTPINGDLGWVKLADGCWVAVAWGEYVSWSSPIPYC
ncbi:hypothetical protein L218DRAFT_958208 [Marasmius fiardii PR-910]|nr:hypothetical protein L218DRAFT_958208 [Marasmius fiardii PR-910]